MPRLGGSQSGEISGPLGHQMIPKTEALAVGERKMREKEITAIGINTKEGGIDPPTRRGHSAMTNHKV